MWRTSLLMAMAVGFVGCAGDEIADVMDPEVEPSPGPGTEPEPEPEPEPQGDSGMVFTISNNADGNAVLAFSRDSDGRLTSLGAFPTGGLGSGGGLGSQAPLVMSEDGQYLYVVNAGSDDISAFKVFDDHLSLISIADSAGSRPVSVTLRGNRLYVVNADESNVAGFAVEDGWLVQIAGSVQPLSTTESPTAPAQIGLHPRGDVLVVTEKATDTITSYRVELDGTLSAPIVTASEGMTPFGFDFAADGSLVVSEAFGGADNASAASSYQVNTNGSLTTLSGSIPSGQSAACWVIVAGQTAYATNTGSNTVSAYRLDESGELTLASEGDGVVASLGDGRRPIDMALASGQRYLYVLNAGTDNILGFRVEDDGALTQIDDILTAPTALGLLAI